MAKPRIFISSTYYDLKHVRSSLEVFVETLGYEPILSEYGGISYDPSQPLDESCYREAQSSDVLVLIIGGRYGSSASSQNQSSKNRDEEFESVTRREFSRAHDADIPVYVLIEQGVYSEYQTYLRNKENESIKYAHVDSSKVFQFIEFIYSKQRNNPVQPFERGSDIESWLKDQWAGLFQELLRQKKDGSRFADLAAQIRQLEAVNSTLKSYLENMLETVSPSTSKILIERENETLIRVRSFEKARTNDWFNYLIDENKMSDSQALDAQFKIGSANDIARMYAEYIKDEERLVYVLNALRTSEEARRDFNDLRKIFGQAPLRFTKKFERNITQTIKEIIGKRSYTGFKPNFINDDIKELELSEDLDDED